MVHMPCPERAARRRVELRMHPDGVGQQGLAEDKENLMRGTNSDAPPPALGMSTWRHGAMVRAFERWRTLLLLHPARLHLQALAQAWMQWRTAKMFEVLSKRGEPASKEEMQQITARNALLHSSVRVPGRGAPVWCQGVQVPVALRLHPLGPLGEMVSAHCI
jgi:hypothetical protein